MSLLSTTLQVSVGIGVEFSNACCFNGYFANVLHFGGLEDATFREQ